MPCRGPTARLAYRCRVRRLCQKISCFLQNVAEAKRRASIFDKGRKSSMAKAMEEQEERQQLAAKSGLGMPSIRFIPASHLLLLLVLLLLLPLIMLLILLWIWLQLMLLLMLWLILLRLLWPFLLLF